MLKLIKKATKKPEKERCFMISTKDPADGSVKKMYFCIFSSKDGSKPLAPNEANLAAAEWVMKLSINMQKSKTDAMNKMLDQVKAPILPDAKELKQLQEKVYAAAIQYDKDCEAKLKLGTKGFTPEMAKDGKMTVVNASIAQVCNGII